MGWRERVRQFRAASAPRFTAADEQFAARWLTAAEHGLFMHEGVYERQHSVALARAVAAGQPAPSRSLIAAALLHDLGKAAAPLTRWQRVGFVLLDAMPGRPLRRMRRPPESSPRYGLWVLQHHAALGVALARAAGVDERTAWLIEHHHEGLPDADLRQLQAADEGAASGAR